MRRPTEAFPYAIHGSRFVEIGSTHHSSIVEGIGNRNLGRGTIPSVGRECLSRGKIENLVVVHKETMWTRLVRNSDLSTPY